MARLAARLGACVALAAGMLAGGAPPAAAFAPAVTVAMTSSPDLTLDSNQPCTAGPRAAYVTFRVTAGGTAQTNLRVTLSGFANGIVLSGGQAATQYLGTLAAGASRYVYWLVEYPCTFGNAATLTASVANDTPGATTGSGTVTTYSMISAQAGGVLVTGVLGPGAVVGQTIEFDVEFEFGGASAGDTYNLQAIGNTGFSAACFQLVRTSVISSGVDAIPLGTQDRQYFVSTGKQTGTGHRATMRFYFKYLCAGVQSPAQPYSNQLSGTQLKYSSNYTTFVGPTLPIATNPFTTTKTASPAALAAGGTVTYTIAVTNPSAFATAVDSIADVLPAGVAFGALAAGSGVTAANSAAVPAAGATGRIVFRGTPGTSYALPAGGTLTLVYTATVTATPGQYTNTAVPATGLTAFASDTAVVTVGTADVSVTKTGPAAAVVGDMMVFVLTTTNAGPGTAYALVVRDSAPAGTTFVSATRGATYAGGVVTFPALAALAPGASVVDTVRLAAPPTLATLVNRGLAGSATIDPAAGNNDGSASGSRVQTTVGSGVDVTPKGIPTPLKRLPGTGYPQVFTVQNAAGAATTYDLIARRTGATPFLVLDSITGPGVTGPAARPDSVRLTLGARTSTAFTVWYTVPAGDTAVDVEYLRARAAADTALRSEGWVDVRRVFPRLTIAKGVSPGGTLAPGTELTYGMTVANAGEHEAASVVVRDSLPPQVDLKVGSPAQTLPAGITATVEYSTDGTGWGYVPASGACGAPMGYDRCARHLRWRLTGALQPGAPASTGTYTFVARIR
jgi:uncharacterized repeat protein (TIGR01451 family)